MYLKFFKDIGINDVKSVGGKGASLGEMTQAQIPVPPGFVITAETYCEFYGKNIPQELQSQILSAFDELKTERVAVRSSAVAEDSKTASWAGQLESYLNVTKEDLITSIQKCWESIHTDRASAYAKQQNLPESQLVVAVVVQKMVNSESSGVMFSVNPITKDQNQIMVEGCFGLGEMLVQGLITPDNFVINKNKLEILTKEIEIKEAKIIYQGGQNKEVQVDKNQQDQPSVSDNQVIELSKLAVLIEQHYQSPQDIEWAIEDGKIYILQSRPVTTLAN